MEKMFQFFFETSKHMLLIVNLNGDVIASNVVAQSYGILPGGHLFSQLVAHESETVREQFRSLYLGENIKSSVQIECSGFPEILVRSRWKVRLIPNTENIAMECDEVCSYTPEDFLLHTGLMKLIFDSDPSLIMIVNRVGQYLFANKAVYDYLNIQQDILLLNRVAEEGELWIPARDLKNAPQELNIQWTTDSLGNQQWFETLRIPLKMPFGDEMLLTISKNISGLKQTEKKLMEHQELISGSMRVAFLGNLLCQFMQNNDVRSVQILRMMQNMEQEIHSEERETPVDFLEILQSTKNLLREKLDAYEIQTDLLCSSQGPVFVLTPYVEIYFVCHTFLQNSMERLSLKQDGSKRSLKIQVVVHHNRFLVSFTDNGIGLQQIEKDDLWDLFEGQKEISKLCQRKKLDLLVCKNLVEKRKGSITVDSKDENIVSILQLPLWEA